MKILYLLFTFLFLAFLSEPGNAQPPECRNIGGQCYQSRCPDGKNNNGWKDCEWGQLCCNRKWKIMPSPSTTMDTIKIWPMT
ncbi:crotasin-like [Protobothrops mucrosquamatus]|uniref:crotasin-like n=1 Tax=Protobothrops mucrosquamatus TaxID=103944 RepID=UPI0007755EB9|nr:crotasin-like [Protobothrops mucrosquamatus]